MTLSRNYRSYYKNIDGWLTVVTANLIFALNEFHSKKNIRGDIFEIGVHHGKLTLLLGTILKSKENLGVCDLFNIQEENVSKSGLGSEKHFLAHWENLLPKKPLPKISKKKSEYLSIEETGRNNRFFCIDGGHTSKETIIDLELAIKSTSEKGIIIIDDVYEPGFPGVAEGFYSCESLRKNWTPLFFAGGRMFLCHKNHKTLYQGFTESSFFKDFCKANRIYTQKKNLLDGEVVIIWQFSKTQFLLKKCRDAILKNKKIEAVLKNSPIKSLYYKAIQPKI